MENKMIKNLSIIGLVTASLLSSNVSYADPQSINQLKDYIDAKEYQQAFKLADKLTYDLAGEVEFDFLSGIAAYGAGKYQEAVFAFERVVILEPLSFHGRYYLALAYQKIDNVHAALNELDALLATQQLGVNLTGQQLSQISQQRQYIEESINNRERRLSHDITLAYGYDSNINSGTSLDAISLPDGTRIPLFDSSRMINATALLARYHANYIQPFNQNQSLTFDFTMQQTQYHSNNDQKRTLFNFNVNYQHKISDNDTLNLGVSSTPFWFAGEKYKTQNSVFTGWKQKVNRNNDFGINVEYSQIDYFTFSSLDLERYRINAYYRYVTNVQHMFIANAYQDKNEFGLTLNDKTSLTFTYALDYPIIENLTGSLALMYETQDYDGLNAFNEYSDSELKKVSSRFNYTGFPQQLLQLELSYQDSNVDSNLEAMKIYEYHRLTANIKWKYNF
jgi:hypothetical protein